MTTMLARSNELDTARVDALSERLMGMFNEGALSLMLSVGHRTGLFDTMAGLAPSTSQQIADAAGLQERYVREWLGAMVTGRFVEYDADTKTYSLPAEHAALLTRGSTLGNFAASMQWMAVLASVEEEVCKAFRDGGGVPYERFHRFHHVMAEESSQTVIAGLREHILPLVPGLVDKLEAGIDVVDIGCGSGWAICTLAEWYPNSRFQGYDLCEDAIENARLEAEQRKISNVTFEVRDITNMDGLGPFDLVTGFDVIHDQKDPAGVLREVHRVLKPGGTFLMQDIRASSHLEKNIGQPLAPFFYTISTMHCMTVSLAQGGEGLGTCWGEELAVRMVTEAGFKDVKVHQPSHDIQNNFYVMTR